MSYGYPEIDFDEAKAESRLHQFLEQALEWPNMTYLFYPYFWNRKGEWLKLAQLSVDDALFNRFLQDRLAAGAGAGAARLRHERAAYCAVSRLGTPRAT